MKSPVVYGRKISMKKCWEQGNAPLAPGDPNYQRDRAQISRVSRHWAQQRDT